MKYCKLQPEDIVVGERFRKDYGDIETLAETILDKGIFQPIIVNQDNELMAGGRRLEAFQKAREMEPDNPHVKAIPAMRTKTDGELEVREIELLENLARKGMSWVEKSNLTRRIHELMEEKHGDKWSLRRSAEIIGISLGSIADQVNLSKALEHFPELERQPTFDAARKVYKRAMEQTLLKQALTESSKIVKGAESSEDGAEEDEEVFDSAYWLKELDASYIIGDAIAGMKKARQESMHFAEVDPPYAVGLQKEKSDGSANIKHYNEIPKEDYPTFLRNSAEAVYSILAPNSCCVWWFAPTWYREVRDTLTSAGFHVDDIPAIWYKTNSGYASNNPDVYLGRGYEPFFLCRKGRPVFRSRGRCNVFESKPVPAAQKIHPTQRPVDLIREIYRTLVYPGARVIVPFLGSGASIIAGRLEGMSMVWGFDLSKQFKEDFLLRGRIELQGKSPRQLLEDALESVEEDDEDENTDDSS